MSKASRCVSLAMWGAACPLLGLTDTANAAVTVCTSDPGRTAASCTFTRDVDFWFGTLDIEGVAAPTQDFFQSTEHLTAVIPSALQTDASVDARVTQGMPAFVDTSGGIDWVLGIPENLPAQQTLLSSYAAADASLDALFGPGTLSLLGVTATNASFLLASTFGFCNASSVLPACDFTDGVELMELTRNFRAQVNFFEQNAVWRSNAPPVPEPSTLAFVVIGLGALAVVRLRRSADAKNSLPT